MGQQYGRALKLTVDGNVITELRENPDNALRVRFKFRSFILSAPNNIQVIVSNLSRSTAQRLASTTKGKKLELEAGYLDNSGLIFSGDLTYVISGRESPTDTTVQLFASDGQNAYDYAVVNKALAKGSTPKDHLDALVQSMAPFGISLGYYSADAFQSPQYPRGVTLSGMAKEHLRTLQSSVGAAWSIQMGQLQMVSPNDAGPGGPYILRTNTGLIGRPSQTYEGIMARVLINPAINLGTGNKVQIDSSLIQGATPDQSNSADIINARMSQIAADGIYKILNIATTGDTRGNEWYMDLTCFALNPAKADFIPDELGPANAASLRN